MWSSLATCSYGDRHDRPDRPVRPSLRGGPFRRDRCGGFRDTDDPRLKHVLISLVRHLHGFAKDVRLTPEEWENGIRFLTQTGQMCDETRQEFILQSDTLGVSMLVEFDNVVHGELTEATVEGPFHVVTSPDRELGEDISVSAGPGERCVVTGRVLDEAGTAVAGAKVDVWQADAEGFHDVQRPAAMSRGDLRGMFTTDAEGGATGSAPSYPATTRSRATDRSGRCSKSGVDPVVALNTRHAGDADRPSTLLASTRRKGAASFMGALMRRLDAGSSSRNQRQKRMFLKLAHS